MKIYEHCKALIYFSSMHSSIPTDGVLCSSVFNSFDQMKEEKKTLRKKDSFWLWVQRLSPLIVGLWQAETPRQVGVAGEESCLRHGKEEAKRGKEPENKMLGNQI